MANANEPDTGASQFFVVLGTAATDLPRQFAEFGAVVEGLDVLRRIEADGAPDPQPPRVIHRITSVTIEEK